MLVDPSKQHNPSDVELCSARYRTLFEQSPLSIQVFTPDGACVEVNETWKKMWEMTPEQMVGFNLFTDKQVLETGTLPLFKRVFAGEMVEFPVTHFDPRLSGIAGRARSIRMVVYPVFDAEKKVSEVVSLSEDVTDQEKTKEELRVKVAALETINAAMVNRELAMIELKKENERLKTGR